MTSEPQTAAPLTEAGRTLVDRYSKGDPTWFIAAVVAIEREAATRARSGLDAELTGRAVHAAWRDGMLAQGREVAPERMAWETLSEEDRLLDDGIAERLALPSDTPADGLDAAYRERNAVVAALIRTNGWPHCVAMADDAPGWVIVYAETPQGQVSWHIGPDDFDLIADFPSSCVSGWDGHTTEEKYRRVAALTQEPRS